MEKTILALSQEIAPRLVELRRQFHSHPELGLEERQTAETVAAVLEELGLEVQRDFYATGVVGLLRGNHPGKTLLLRGDMDALSVQERNECPYSSQTAGKMHACGHDAHTTWLLGAAMLLSRMKEQLHGNVKFMFQPAEECPGGADAMIKNGLLCNPTVDFAMGAHVTPDVDAGKYVAEDGPVTSNPDFFHLQLKGKGAHGSTPQESVDALNMGVQAYNLLQSFVSRLSDPCDPVVLSVCVFQSGTARGIIPDTCVLQGTVRSFRPEIRTQAKAFLEDCARSVTSLYGGTYDLQYEATAFPVQNDPAFTARVRRNIGDLLGKEAVFTRFKKFMGGEDYCFVAREVPSTFLFVGCKNDRLFEAAPLHNPRFQLDEGILATTAAVLAYNALQLLQEEDG